MYRLIYIYEHIYIYMYIYIFKCMYLYYRGKGLGKVAVNEILKKCLKSDMKCAPFTYIYIYRYMNIYMYLYVFIPLF
jgi:hypothetical protein